jgi:hypothetical protein
MNDEIILTEDEYNEINDFLKKNLYSYAVELKQKHLDELPEIELKAAIYNDVFLAEAAHIASSMI